MYEKVLVPLDGSELAECALVHAETMVKEGFAGEITLFNVVKIDHSHLIHLQAQCIPSKRECINIFIYIGSPTCRVKLSPV